MDSPGAFEGVDLSALHSEQYTHHYKSTATRGVRLFHAALHVADPLPSNTWTEVMRWPRLCEEENGYGAWFARAPGSGIYVNTNSTWVVRDRSEALGLPPHSTSSPGEIVSRWLMLHGLPTSTQRTPLAEWRTQQVGPRKSGRTLMLGSAHAMQLLAGLGGAWCDQHEATR